MAKINDFFVGFDKQYAVYGPGEAVSGHVDFDFGDKIYADQVVAQFYGAARVFWVDREIQPPNGLQSVPFSQEKIYFDEKSVLWQEQSGDGETQKNLDKVLAHSASGLRLKMSMQVPGADEKRSFLNAGRHTMPFEFLLPDMPIPTSFDARNSVGCVRYYVKVSIMEWGQLKHSRKGFFTVVRPFDLNSIPRALGSNSKTADRSVKSATCFGPAGTDNRVSALLTAQKCGYVPGEQLQFSVEVDNKTDRSVKSVVAKLVQRTTCYAIEPEFRMKSSSLSTVMAMMPQTNKIRSKQLYLFEPILYVPAVVPTFLLENCIEVNYVIVVEVFFDRKSSQKCLSLDMPILIGTVPLIPQTLQTDILRQRPIAGKAPPPYDDQQPALIHDFQSPPPTYEESVMGQSNVSPQEVYSPQYPVYHNLPINNENSLI